MFSGNFVNIFYGGISNTFCIEENFTNDKCSWFFVSPLYYVLRSWSGSYLDFQQRTLSMQKYAHLVLLVCLIS